MCVCVCVYVVWRGVCSMWRVCPDMMWRCVKGCNSHAHVTHIQKGKN